MFYCKGNEALEQVAQRHCRLPISDTQGQTGWVSVLHGLMGDVPAHSRELGLDDL